MGRGEAKRKKKKAPVAIAGIEDNYYILHLVLPVWYHAELYCTALYPRLPITGTTKIFNVLNHFCVLIC